MHGLALIMLNLTYDDVSHYGMHGFEVSQVKVDIPICNHLLISNNPIF